MNVATENNNELGISLFLWGVRGGGYLYRVDRRGFVCGSAVDELVPLWLCVSSCVSLSDKGVFGLYIE